MKKMLALVLIIVISPLLGGLYGILHDQLTYSISHEYFTKFKFIQFGFKNPKSTMELPHPRLYVAAVGFLATWWMGLFIGTILGLCNLIQRNGWVMFIITMRAFLVTTVIAFIAGLVGLAYGKFHLIQTGVNWWLPDNLKDVDAFITVGSMHNFSYLGGLIGLLVAIIYSIRARKRA